ncbi:MAG: Peptidase [Thermoleophilia bacterium]|nr:Peptidase [Thermoleophilia bacterium]
MNIARLTTVLVAASLVLGGCAGKGEDAKAKPSTSKAGRAASSLVVEGAPVRTNGARLGATKAAPTKRVATPTPSPRPKVPVRVVEKWPAPKLLPDGTIDDGPDPIGTAPVQVQPLPIEDDPTTTAAIDKWSTRLRKVDLAQWNQWMDAGLRSPWSQAQDAALSSMVKVTVERCGGAHTVATGVVLADETVVTTVHAIESPNRRVRISPATGGARIPAMVRYLDVDDDIAVLKVPGLVAPPMLFHVVTGDKPQWGYAYGVGTGGPAGTMRRTPAVVAMREATATLEQPDGFAQRITDRAILPFVGGVSAGFSGGVVMATNDPEFVSGWGFHGLIRARVPFRADTGGIAVPATLVGDALDAADKLDPWYEHRAGSCPQWIRHRHDDTA